MFTGAVDSVLAVNRLFLLRLLWYWFLYLPSNRYILYPYHNYLRKLSHNKILTRMKILIDIAIYVACKNFSFENVLY